MADTPSKPVVSPHVVTSQKGSAETEAKFFKVSENKDPPKDFVPKESKRVSKKKLFPNKTKKRNRYKNNKRQAEADLCTIDERVEGRDYRQQKSGSGSGVNDAFNEEMLEHPTVNLHYSKIATHSAGPKECGVSPRGVATRPKSQKRC